jgi:hypothetical protein
MASSGGTTISKNDCAYGEDGFQLDNVMENLLSGGQESLFENLLEVDPQLDSNSKPTNPLVIKGGAPDVSGNETSIGAIPTSKTRAIFAQDG